MGGDLERHPRLRERPLGANDALRHRRLGDQVGTGDLGGRQSRKQTQGQRNPGVARQHRVAGGEHEPQQVVLEGIVDVRREIGRFARSAPLGLVAELACLSLVYLGATQAVDRPVLAHSHQPAARVLRHARVGPLLEGGDECLLGEVLGEADIADETCKAGDQPRRLDAPDGIDRPVDIARPHALAATRAET